MTKTTEIIELHVSTELTAEHTRTHQRKTVKAATGCGIHSLVVMIFYTTCTFQYNGWMSVRMRTGFRRCLRHNRHCYHMRQFQNLVEQLRGVGEWLRCLLVVLYVGGVGGSSLRLVSQFSVVHECGVDAWRVGERTMKRIRKAVEMKREGERGKSTKYQPKSFCVHLAAIGDSNDRPVSVDQPRRHLPFPWRHYSPVVHKNILAVMPEMGIPWPHLWWVVRSVLEM